MSTHVDKHVCTCINMSTHVHKQVDRIFAPLQATTKLKLITNGRVAKQVSTALLNCLHGFTH